MPFSARHVPYQKSIYTGNSIRVASAEKKHFVEYFIRIINKNAQKKMPGQWLLQTKQQRKIKIRIMLRITPLVFDKL